MKSAREYDIRYILFFLDKLLYALKHNLLNDAIYKTVEQKLQKLV